MKFEKFVEVPYERKAKPARMYVGQIIVRKGIAPGYVPQLKCDMRRAMRDDGMEFSTGWDSADYAIRRDK